MDNRKLVAAVARKLGRDKDDVGKLVEALAGVVAARCGELDIVTIPGFGSFEPQKHDEYITTGGGERTLHPPRVTLGFRTSAVLKGKLK